MQIILLERIEKLGQMGDVVTVRDGFARNFLLPAKKALRATAANRQHFESRRGELEARNLEQRTEAEAVATKLDGVELTLLRQAGETGQLYGSVNSRDIAEALSEAGFATEKKQVALNAPIKTLGVFRVRIVLHPEVVVEVSASVARSAEEAQKQLSREAGKSEEVIDAEQFFESRELAEEAVAELSDAESTEAAEAAGTAADAREAEPTAE